MYLNYLGNAEMTGMTTEPFTKDDLLAAMRDDHAHRYAGVTDGLISLDEIIAEADGKPTRVWDNSLPTIRGPREDTLYLYQWDPEAARDRLRRVLVDVATVNESWQEGEYDYDEIDGTRSFVRPEASRCYTAMNRAIKAGSFVLAGGKLRYALWDRCSWCGIHSDYDLFVCGGDAENAETAIEALFSEFKEQSDDFRMFVNENCVTMISAKLHINVQVILRMYSSISEIIHGFDIGAAQVAWDGENVWFTSMGRVAYEQGINVLNLSKRRGTYEKRLIKYTDRGFGLVLPNLRLPNVDEICDMLKIKCTGEDAGRVRVPVDGRRHGELCLPNLTIEIPSYTFSSFVRDEYDACDVLKYASICLPGDGYDTRRTSDYGGDIAYHNVGAVDFINFRKFTQPDNDFYFYECKSGKLADAEFVCSQEAIVDYLSKKIEARNSTPVGLTIDYMYGLLPTLKDRRSSYLDSLMIVAGIIGSPDDKIEAAKSITRSMVQRVMAEWRAENPDSYGFEIKWKTVEEGTTLINPFTMSIMSEDDWYGEWYAEPSKRVSHESMHGGCQTPGEDACEFSEEQLNEMAERVFEKLKPMIREYMHTVM